MARRSHRSKKSAKMNLAVPLGILGAVVVLGGGLWFAVQSEPGQGARVAEEQDFSIAEYRNSASRLTGNRYRLTARVENIETLGNDRLLAVSLPGNQQERLPLLVRGGVAQNVNLTRGDSFVFDVECLSGREDDGREVKGVMVVKRVETK